MAKIKKDTNLRKSILQAAITGQLISNVEGETKTGKELLDKIIEERNAKLLAQWEEAKKKNPKAKKPAPIVPSEITEDEIPFEIPKSWCWCRLGDVAFIARGGSPRPINEYLTNDSDGYNWIKISDTDKGGKYINSTKQRIKKEGLYKTRLIHKGDFLLTNSMSFGRPYISNIEGCIHDGWLVFSFPNNCIISDFIYHLLSSSFIYKQFADSAAGAVVQNLNTDKVIETILPLPPLAVQNAIVAKLEEVLPLVDAYENAVLQKEELKTALPDKVKKAILQEAIQGKLTKSWRKTTTIEESGKQLLDRIIEERNAKLLADWEEAKKKNPKAKKPAPIVASEIAEDEIPFEIPESWCWCRLGDVFSTMSGLGYKKDVLVEKSEKMIRVLRGGNILDTSYIFKPDDIMISDKYVKPELFLKKNYLITPAVTSLEHIGKIGYVEKDYTDTVVGGFVLMLIPHYHNEILSKYFLYLFGTRWLRDMCKEITNKSGQAFYNLSRDKLLQLQIPLPPLAEQEKIVEIIEQMLPLCEKLG
ncbi:restriction endonuclease subunit S [Campylobacter devanensis]|uniref:Type I restriction/modification system, S subunit n=1 Tax=Campylobacter devanensis TaxID=3161138 RepID=A0A1X9SSA8_9BACT|nr:restriction endonuclease subunit S [Campylobacter lanienae]ARQ99115.1 type I restriction/modification system, S subunit [Campylobacter lanienae]